MRLGGQGGNDEFAGELPLDARAPGGRDYQDYAKRHRRAS